MILSVGYRVNSKRGIAFRKWAKKTVLVRLKDAKGNERLTRQEDDWLYEQGIDEGDLVVLTENHLYKKMEER